MTTMRATQLDMRATQLDMRAIKIQHNDTLYDIQQQLADQGTRITAMEDEMRDWHFYDEHRYYPEPSSPQD